MSDTNQDNLRLCHSLLNADSEHEVISLLKQAGYWDSPEAWEIFDGNENNYSTIGNQQASPAAALVEKIINSIDAVLLRECRIRKINPESSKAPKSMESALEEYFKVKNGNLALVTPNQRTLLAGNIGLIATGQKTKKPSYTIFDKGEGQSPNKIPATFLSLNKSNKLRIHFVQGKFNMGGTGVFRFCDDVMQLVVSKRHPEIIDKNDDSATYWGFTIVRRQNPSEGRKNSMYTYLAPGGKILRFKSLKIQISPKEKGTQPIPPLEWGSIIKLYEYGMTPPALCTNVKFDLYNYISLLTPKIGLPIRFYERRKYAGKSLEATMSGLHVRLEDARGDIIEDGFPTSAEFKIDGQKFKASIYVFREGKADNYREKEGIIFTYNGQSHGSLPNSFFTRGAVRLSYIADSILIIVECDEIDDRTREKLIMNTRDRLSAGVLEEKIEDELEEILKHHSGLRSLQESRRREAMNAKLADSKPLKEVIDELLKRSPLLQELFIKGFDISNPFKSKLVGEKEHFIGKQYPSYFKLMIGEAEKECHINQRFRVQFETDVVNDYFIRDTYPGRFDFELDGEHSEYVYHLLDGVFTLSVTLPPNTKIGDKITGKACITDETQLNPFCGEFSRFVKSPLTVTGGSRGRKPPAGSNNGKRQFPDSLSLPQIIEVREEEWVKYNFDKYCALMIKDTGTGAYDFYVNVDNVFLKKEVKLNKGIDSAPLLQAKFVYGLVLFGLAIIKNKDEIENPSGNLRSGEDSDLTIEKLVLISSKSFAPIILPMVEILGQLGEEEISKPASFEYDVQKSEPIINSQPQLTNM